MSQQQISKKHSPTSETKFSEVRSVGVEFLSKKAEILNCDYSFDESSNTLFVKFPRDSAVNDSFKAAICATTLDDPKLSIFAICFRSPALKGNYSYVPVTELMKKVKLYAFLKGLPGNEEGTLSGLEFRFV